MPRLSPRCLAALFCFPSCSRREKEDRRRGDVYWNCKAEIARKSNSREAANRFGRELVAASEVDLSEVPVPEVGQTTFVLGHSAAPVEDACAAPVELAAGGVGGAVLHATLLLDPGAAEHWPAYTHCPKRAV